MVKSIAIIPARGASKRIPRKNLADVGGRPLIAWTIEAARSSGYFDRVIVSTDDQEIAQVARSQGAEVPFLRSLYADDHAPASAATLHTLTQCEAYFSESYDTVCQLMATTPLRDGDVIAKAVDHFASSDAPAQLSCVAFGWQNPWWAMTLDDKGVPTQLFPEALKARSQDLQQLYVPSGAIWLARAERLKFEGTFYTGGHTFYPISWLAGIDIDTFADLEMVRGLVSAQG